MCVVVVFFFSFSQTLKLLIKFWKFGSEFGCMERKEVWKEGRKFESLGDSLKIWKKGRKEGSLGERKKGRKFKSK